MKSLKPCPTLCGPTDYCSPPGCSVRGILQARILERVAIPFSRGSSQLRGGTRVFRIAARRFTVWTTREAVIGKSGCEQSKNRPRGGKTETLRVLLSPTATHLVANSEWAVVGAMQRGQPPHRLGAGWEVGGPEDPGGPRRPASWELTLGRRWKEELMPLEHAYPSENGTVGRITFLSIPVTTKFSCFGYICQNRVKKSIKNKCSGQVFRIILKIKRYWKLCGLWDSLRLEFCYSLIFNRVKPSCSIINWLSRKK